VSWRRLPQFGFDRYSAAFVPSSFACFLVQGMLVFVVYRTSWRLESIVKLYTTEMSISFMLPR
jgi:hypothetical protein